MIREFPGKKRLFFPVSWANSVTRWMTGIHSPTGTVKIGNTVNPGEEKGVTIDVDIDAVAEKVRQRKTVEFDNSFIRKIRDLIHLFIDGISVVWKGGRLAVNEEWLDARITSAIGSGGSGGEDPEDPEDPEEEPDYLTESDIGVTVAEFNHEHPEYLTGDELGGAAYLDVGSTAGTVASGYHLHTNVYAPKVHTHDGYAASDHTHEEYAESDHKHSPTTGTFYVLRYKPVDSGATAELVFSSLTIENGIVKGFTDEAGTLEVLTDIP